MMEISLAKQRELCAFMYKKLLEIGITPSDLPEEQRENLCTIIELCLHLVPEARISGLFTYKRGGQTERFSQAAAMYVEFIIPDMGTCFCIGVSEEVLANLDETVYSVLHELSHVVNGPGHTRAFYESLDDYVERWKRETGVELTLDKKHRDHQRIMAARAKLSERAKRNRADSKTAFRSLDDAQEKPPELIRTIPL